MRSTWSARAHAGSFVEPAAAEQQPLQAFGKRLAGNGQTAVGHAIHEQPAASVEQQFQVSELSLGEREKVFALGFQVQNAFSMRRRGPAVEADIGRGATLSRAVFSDVKSAEFSDDRRAGSVAGQVF